MGNNDEIFVLDDGTIWQVKYEYEYLYEYLPSVVICPSEGKLIVNGKSLNVQSLSGRSSNSPSDDVIESRIDGEFKGWEGESIYKLTNGQVWQQSSYHYHYHYAFRPAVLIYKRNGVVMIHVDGDNDRDVPVKRLR
jgi:hypothetical protein